MYVNRFGRVTKGRLLRLASSGAARSFYQGRLPSRRDTGLVESSARQRQGRRRVRRFNLATTAAAQAAAWCVRVRTNDAVVHAQGGAGQAGTATVHLQPIGGKLLVASSLSGAMPGRQRTAAAVDDGAHGSSGDARTNCPSSKALALLLWPLPPPKDFSVALLADTLNFTQLVRRNNDDRRRIATDAQKMTTRLQMAGRQTCPYDRGQVVSLESWALRLCALFFASGRVLYSTLALHETDSANTFPTTRRQQQGIPMQSQRAECQDRHVKRGCGAAGNEPSVRLSCKAAHGSSILHRCETPTKHSALTGGR